MSGITHARVDERDKRPLSVHFRKQLTRILISSAHFNNIGSNSHVFKNLVAVTHRIEERSVVVQIQHVDINGNGG